MCNWNLHFLDICSVDVASSPETTAYGAASVRSVRRHFHKVTPACMPDNMSWCCA